MIDFAAQATAQVIIGIVALVVTLASTPYVGTSNGWWIFAAAFILGNWVVAFYLRRRHRDPER